MALNVKSPSPERAHGVHPPVSGARDLLRIEGLSISVPGHRGRFHAVSGASFDVAEGEAVGLVGESGSGKTLTCRAVLGVLPPGCKVDAGTIAFESVDLATIGRSRWRSIHGSEIGAVFQDPASYLHPSLPVGDQLAEVLRTKQSLSRKDANARAIELLAEIGLPHALLVARQLPSELSGGMLQRVMIAIAISCDPKLLVADEATTALDVVTQADVLELLTSLRHRLGLSILFVSHDLAVVAEVCDRIVVFYAGQVVEVGTTDALTDHPRHPYTDALLRVGSARTRSGGILETIPGQPPSLDEMPTGCRFAPRCPFADDRCSAGPIPLTEVSPGHAVRCVRAGELSLEGTEAFRG
jgi:peptide/nickel transport system ATP-binding protein